VRPGEQGHYVSLLLSDEELRALRERAREIAMSVDALIAALTELLSARALLRTLGLEVNLVDICEVANGRLGAIAPTEALRHWVEALEGRSPTALAPASDDLPQVLLPSRLEPRLRGVGIAALIEAVGSGDVALAKRCDAVAARNGLTLTEWALAGALALETCQQS
jgi:hypothetical protein